MFLTSFHKLSMFVCTCTINEKVKIVVGGLHYNSDWKKKKKKKKHSYRVCFTVFLIPPQLSPSRMFPVITEAGSNHCSQHLLAWTSTTLLLFQHKTIYDIVSYNDYEEKCDGCLNRSVGLSTWLATFGILCLANLLKLRKLRQKIIKDLSHFHDTMSCTMEVALPMAFT